MICMRLKKDSTVCVSHSHVQPIAFGVSFNFNLQSQSHWSLFNQTWQKRPRELDCRFRFENEEMTLQLQYAVTWLIHM